MKENNIEITVLMSVYNTPIEQLRKAIESILSQTYENFEFLIIDDGSKNGEIELIKSYKDTRIKILKNEKKNSAFFDLSINDYDKGRITTPVVQQTSQNSNMRNMLPVQQKKQPEKRTDDDLLKWLEG